MTTNRTTLTKSLHTVSSVSRLAEHLYIMGGNTETIDTLVSQAIAILGVAGHESADQTDPVWLACVAATTKRLAK